MEDFDGQAEVKRLKGWKILWKVLSACFFGLSLVFLVLYLALPSSKCSSISITSSNKATSFVSSTNERSTLLSKNDVLSAMGLGSNSYSVFVNTSEAEESLRSAPFVASVIRPSVSKGPFHFSVSFADLFPIVSIEGKNYLSDGKIYPYDGIETGRISSKDEWVMSSYPDTDETKVSFLEDSSYADHNDSIPYLFYCWKVLDSSALQGIRYEGLTQSYYFYVVTDSGVYVRIGINKTNLNRLTPERFDEICGLDQDDFSGRTPSTDEYADKFNKGLPSEWIVTTFMVSGGTSYLK